MKILSKFKIKYISSGYFKILDTKYNVEKIVYKIQMYFPNTKYIALILLCLTRIDSNLIKELPFFLVAWYEKRRCKGKLLKNCQILTNFCEHNVF